MLKLQVALGIAPIAIEGVLQDLTGRAVVRPGLAELQLARVHRLGRRDKYPRPYDWENLLPLLRDGDELLWIVRKDRGAFSVHIGLKPNRVVAPMRDTVQHRKSDFAALLRHFERRCFPESRTERLRAGEADTACGEFAGLARDHFVLVSGTPSPKVLEGSEIFERRDEERRPYASLNDALEPFAGERSFAIVFSVCRAGTAELDQTLTRLTGARSLIHPYIEYELGKNQVVQRGGHRDEARGSHANEGRQSQPHLGAKLWQLMVGNEPTGEGRNSPSVSYQRGTSETETVGENWGVQRGHNENRQILDANLELIDERLKLMIQHLTPAMGTGAYYGSAAVYSEDVGTSLRIGRAVIGALSGSQSHVRPFSAIPYRGNAQALLRFNGAPHTLLSGVALLNTQQAGQLLMTPEAELPGLMLKRNVFYGRAVKKDDKPDGLPSAALGRLSFMSGENVPKEEAALFVRASELLSHVLVSGTTGSGKTVRTVEILNGLDPQHFRVVVIETAKKTFRRLLRRGGQPKVYSLGAPGEQLRINPFFFDPGTSLKRHISVVCDALADLLPVEALIGPKLREAVLNCYREHSWNIETGTYVGVGEPEYPDVIDLNVHVTRVCASLQYSQELNQNYMGALLGRSRLFIDDLYQDIFGHSGNAPIGDLFAEDTIIELDDLPPSEINMPAFVVSLVLQRLRAQAVLQRNASSGPPLPYHLVVIEEAHNILHKKLEAETDARQTGGGRHLLEQVVRLLQEGRDLGIGVIVVDQSPASLAGAVLKNTNTKLVHRLVDGEETKAIGSAIGLDENEWPDIAQLEDGECVASVKGASKPIKLAPYDDTERASEQKLEIAASAPPDYVGAYRCLDSHCNKSCTLIQVTAAAEALMRACGGSLALANYNMGRYLAWNERLGEGVERVAPTVADVPGVLAGFVRGRLSSEAELIRLLLRACDPDDDGVDGTRRVADQVFGDAWEYKAARTIAGLIRRTAAEFAGDASAPEFIIEAMNEWVAKGSSATLALRWASAEGQLLWCAPVATLMLKVKSALGPGAPGEDFLAAGVRANWLAADRLVREVIGVAQPQLYLRKAVFSGLLSSMPEADLDEMTVQYVRAMGG